MKKKAANIRCVFLDIGGVLLTDGWEHHARRRAAAKFRMDFAEMEARHHLVFETYEEGKITLKEYLNRVVFDQKRLFTPLQFRSFMFVQSKKLSKMIQFIGQLKARHQLKVAVVSNEGRELNNAFISSSHVHIRKPDADTFRLALDIAQVPARKAVYIENTPMFVQVAEGLRIRGILHQDYEPTCAELASMGLENEGGGSFVH